MDCPVTKPLADALRSILEQHLQKLDERGTISSAARAWQRSLSQQGQAHLLQEPDPVSARQWLVHIPSRQAELTSDVAGHSVSAVLAEGESDLARRGVLPMDFGNAIYCGRAVLLLSIRSHPWMIWPLSNLHTSCILTNWQTNLPRHLRGEFV